MRFVAALTALCFSTAAFADAPTLLWQGGTPFGDHNSTLVRTDAGYRVLGADGVIVAVDRPVPYASSTFRFPIALNDSHYVALNNVESRYFSGGFWGRLVAGHIDRQDVRPIAGLGDIKLYAAARAGDRTWVAVERFHESRIRIATFSDNESRARSGPQFALPLSEQDTTLLSVVPGALELVSVDRGATESCRIGVRRTLIDASTMRPDNQSRICLQNASTASGIRLLSVGPQTWIAIGQVLRATQAWRIALQDGALRATPIFHSDRFGYTHLHAIADAANGAVFLAPTTGAEESLTVLRLGLDGAVDERRIDLGCAGRGRHIVIPDRGGAPLMLVRRRDCAQIWRLD